MIGVLERIRREQEDSARRFLNASSKEDKFGAFLGLQDWIKEEVLELEEHPEFLQSFTQSKG